jgi:hypothetical protein
MCSADCVQADMRPFTGIDPRYGTRPDSSVVTTTWAASASHHAPSASAQVKALSVAVGCSSMVGATTSSRRQRGRRPAKPLLILPAKGREYWHRKIAQKSNYFTEGFQ